MCPCITSATGRVLGLAALSLFSPPGMGEQNTAYRFESAAMEISQLYWLAETAAVCGWATTEESERFKQFSVRFLSAHLSTPARAALESLAGDARHAASLHQAALDGAAENCVSSRWHAGWDSFKAAADENEGEY